MTTLTAGGSFAQSYMEQFAAEIASYRDLGEATFIEKINQSETIIHNAATIETNELELSVARNFDFTRLLVNQLKAVNPNANLIFLSSMSILDTNSPKLYGDVMNMTPYSYSKYLAETFCLKSGLNRLNCVRFSTLFYKDPKKDGLSKLIAEAVTTGKITIYNGGEARRNFLPLHIAAQYVNKLLDYKKDDSNIFTIAASSSTSFRDIAALLQKLIPGLKIEDKQSPTGNPVLSEFNSDSILELGVINFSLEAEITSYLNALKS